MTITGGCLCGSVRYEIASEPIVARACWCRVCQYIGAGSGTVNAVFARDTVTIQGEVHDFQSVADSGNIMRRRFCPKCGTHIFSGSEALPDRIVVRLGTFDNPELARPEITIWTATAPSWACIDGTIPQTDGPPPT